MLVKTISDAVLRNLAEIGIKERTIAHNYSCFYRALCKEVGEKELDETLVSSYLLEKQGKDVWNLAYYQLSPWEQTCRHAFQILLEYQATGQLKVQCRNAEGPGLKDIKAMEDYLLFCTEAGNVTRTLSRKQATIRRFLTAYPLKNVNSSSILAYVQSFAGKSTYYQKRELDEIRKFLGFCLLHGYISQDFNAAFPDIRAVKDSRIPSVFTVAEIKKLLHGFSESASKNRLRNYAMVLLMVIYGFRSIDISSLSCSCLDFENGEILISQSKTGTVLRHHILPHVGNAMADYILHERPKSSSKLLFLKADGDGLASKSVSGVVRNGFCLLILILE